MNPKVCGADVDNLLTPVVGIRRLPLAGVVERGGGSGQSYRKRDAGCKAAKCKEGHGYIYIIFILTNDQISNDRR